MAKIPTEEKVSSQFPAGLRVLAIDNDPTVLKNIEQMCIQCHYRVITCSHAPQALNLVRERKDFIDVILIDVHMPNMDGYEFLQHISKEIDVPVIVMSFDDATSTRMKAIQHGVCDYWKKPLHEDQFRNMWMHVARKAWNENKLRMKFGSLEDDDGKKRGNDDSEFASSVVEATGGVVREQKKSCSKESDADEQDEYYPPPAKKSRVIWTDELHHTFVKAVMQIGLDKAVPKRILEVMNVPNLTRENVASHLQKYRHQLKSRSDGVTLQLNEKPLSNTVPGTTECRVGTSGRYDFQALAATSHVPYETLAALHPELTSNFTPKEDQWPNHLHAEQDVTYGHPLAKCPSNIASAKNFPQSIMTLDEASRYGVWPPSNTVGIEKLSIQKNNVLMDQQRQESLMHHQIHSINLQPSSMVVSGNSPSVTGIFQGYTTTPASIPVQGLTSGAVLRSFPANTQVSYGSTSGDSLYQESLRNLGYDDDKEMCIPRTSAGFESKSCASDEELPEEDHRLL